MVFFFLGRQEPAEEHCKRATGATQEGAFLCHAVEKRQVDVTLSILIVITKLMIASMSPPCFNPLEILQDLKNSWDQLPPRAERQRMEKTEPQLLKLLSGEEKLKITKIPPTTI